MYLHGKLLNKMTRFHCHNSSGKYSEPSSDSRPNKYGELQTNYYFSNKCENDEESFQACGFAFSSSTSNPIQSLKNAVCEWKVEESGQVLKLEFEPPKTNDTINLPTGQIIDKHLLCNDRCDIASCEDESVCNGYRYGQFCRDDTGNLTYIQPRVICTRDHLKYRGNQCNNTEICSPNNTLEQNKCDKIHSKISDSPLYDMIPVFNFTRCSPHILCNNRADQFNCTDNLKIGVTCEIGGLSTTVSKYVVCKDSSVFCDDGIDGACYLISPTCRVHKHSLCNGEFDCQDESDENISICRSMTRESCVRRGGNGTVSLPLPLVWIRDGVRDCVDGRDEKGIWPTCGSDRTRRYVSENGTCSNVFLCRNGKPGFIELDDLCDGIETCGNENALCETSRGAASITRALQIQSTDKSLSYCLRGLESIWTLSHPCIMTQFIFPTDNVYGLTKPNITVPSVTTDCDHMYGEQYVYTSCTNKCTNSSCPLKQLPTYSSCPGQYPKRVGTIVNNDYLTFVLKSGGSQENLFINNLFVCDDGIKCVPYSKVCDLVADCVDRSDEKNCTNHFECAISGSYIPLTNKCDDKFDCLDMTDECNDECSKEMLEGIVLKSLSWMIGLLAVFANSIIVISSIQSLTKCRTTVALTNKSLITMISFGDLLVGLYLLSVSGYDGLVHGKDYCFNQTMWLTSSSCSILGVVSTVGSQLSLFAMTVLSLVRLSGIWNSMRIPGEVNARSAFKIIGVSFILLALSAVLALLPILENFKDFFINGIRYDEGLKLFIGPVNKETHFKMFEKYFGRMKKTTLSWDLAEVMLSDMFSHESGLLDFTMTQTKVGFYGNGGVCLFKYFIRNTDPQKMFIWTMLVLNFVCFVLISVCYIIISSVSTKSSRNVNKNNNQSCRRNKRMNQKISIIISTDFLCWVPFIVICTLHYMELLDATPWYSFFSMIVLPLNSAINPVLYSNNISTFGGRFVSRTYNRMSLFASNLSKSIKNSQDRAQDTNEMEQNWDNA